MAKQFITSESVTEGHPDKVCDQISDAILDAYLEQDSESRVGVETLATNGLILIAGEVRSKAKVDPRGIAKEVLERIGYTDPSFGLDSEDTAILTSIQKHCDDIALGIDTDKAREQGAGDQGMMYGYACDETPELLPLPITIAHKLTSQLAKVRKDRTLPYLGPDGKAQVSVEYEDEVPQRISAVVVSTQHRDNVPLEKIRRDVKENVILPVCKDLIDDDTVFHINPTGRFVTGGPEADTGLTGRKLIVDTYGGIGRHGGGAFSGKDPSKTDRSGGYVARWIAKNIVAAGLARRCEIQLSYAIGVAEPTSIHVNTFGTGTVPDELLARLVREQFDLRPGAVIEQLQLKSPIYGPTACYGHFGRKGFSWEETNKAVELNRAVQVLSKPITPT